MADGSEIAVRDVGGRPSILCQELAETICEGIATSPRGLDFLCEANEGWPAPSTIYRWLDTKGYEWFKEQYTRARARQADRKFDQTWEIADASTPETVQVDRLKIDTIKWQAGKLAPKKYGDHSVVDVKGELVVSAITRKIVAEPVRVIEGQARDVTPKGDE